jgi:leucyl-tRNA synthetase
MALPYDPQQIEPRWQEFWARERFAAVDTAGAKDLYMLMMFPYPSGDLHVGHGRNYILGDCLFRMFLMQGRKVLNPMGWDAFGLPAENAAIKRNIHPHEWTVGNIARMKEQFRRWGILYDWDKEVTSCEPEYYRWNQWLFNRMLEKGLAYRGKSPVNWCPSCKTVLANEQVVAGGCERCGTAVEQRDLEQWFLRITEYADRLLEGLDRLPEWPEKVKTMQRNWIGRSEGCDLRFAVEGVAEPITVFTTRVDTIYGATFVALAPEHPLVERFRATAPDPDFGEFVDRLRNQTRLQRESEGGDKEGRFTGAYAINPFSGERVPIWVANFVLMEYGTGAIMSVPAHDERDFAFATEYSLPIRLVIAGPGMIPDTVPAAAYSGPGTVVNSGPFSGLASEESKAKMGAFAEENGFGTRRVRYRLRDWLISRQRYWGTPIPVVYCERDGIIPVPDGQLPVVLPTDIQFGGSEGNPLERSASFTAVRCPKCGEPARRETDTMDTFVDSSWYYARFVNPHVHDAMIDQERVARWMPVDLYIGGVEHAILHLMYARFLYKVFHDFGMVPGDEPFTVLFNQGMITAKSAVTGKLEKMSKSKGNVVAPDALIARYGADTERVYTLFMGPPEKEVEWTEDGVMGAHRFLQRVWGLQDIVAESAGRVGEPSATEQVLVAVHRTVKRVHDDLARYHPNTATAAMMELINTMAEHQATASGGVLRQAYETLLRLLHPIAPHITEEIWRILGHEGSLLRAGWPSFDAALLAKQQVTLAVQVNGKLRATIDADPGLDAQAAGSVAREAIAKWLDGKRVVKVIHVPDRMVSFVVKG